MVERFPAVPDLTHLLRQLLFQVPAGRVATCGDLAEALGNRIAARWVGHYALHHEHKPDCPCHRIVRVGGELGPYIEGEKGTGPICAKHPSGRSGKLDLSPFLPAGSIRAKTRKLTAEGVVVRQGAIDLERFGFHEFISERPLEQLRQVQETIQRRIILRPRLRMPNLVGGVDVAYPQPDVGVAAYALVETATGQLVWSTTVRRRVAFPYISTYLSFREIPILLDLLDEVRSAGRMAEVLLVDGSGILHHRHAGIASHLGVVASLPTVGLTKKLLCGKVDIKGMTPGESRPVVYEKQGSRHTPCAVADGTRSVPATLGVAMRPTAGSLRPIFLSPGHCVDVEFCERLVRRLLMKHRLPEPVYWADRLSRSSR